MADNTLIDTINTATSNFLKYFKKDKPHPDGGSQSQSNIDKVPVEDMFEVAPDGTINRKFTTVDEYGMTHPM